MNSIGLKIKELRRKMDITQEKLADYLCVSYQAVSKWETGVSCPDLSLIAPLTKVLHVSADELLGLTEAKPDVRRGELEEAYKKTWNTGDLDERMKISKSAVNEYPGDMKYLEWLASCVYMRAFTYKDDGEYRVELEKSVKFYQIVIENTDDGEVRTSAISGIVMALSLLNRKEEALKYAEMYPEKPSLDKSDVISWCYSGDEKLKHEQKMVIMRLEDLLRQLNKMYNLEYHTAADEIIKIMIPDRNYLYFNDFLYMSSIKQALCLTQSGNYDEAVNALHKALGYAIEYDKMIEDTHENHKYTAPMLNLVEVDTREIVRTGTGTRSDGFYEWLDSFALLRDRDDFQELVARKAVVMSS